jgi:magnesium chelatase subunit D
VPAALCDRLAIWLELDQMAFEADTLDLDAARVAAARALLPDVQADPASLDMLCATALGVGAFSLRVPLLARTVARCAAALAGRTAVLEDDLIFAARLVIAPRATLLPAPAEDETAPEPTQQEAEPHEAAPSNGESDQADATTGGALEDKVLSACVAAIPPHLLASLTGGMDRQKAAHAGRSGVTQRGLARGRPVGTRAGAPRRGARLDLIATLRAAAPWQPLRRGAATSAVRPRVIVMADDFRIVRFKQQVEATIVFVVDASGSAAVQRLAEAKGAVEMLLADCYIRRDQVALLAFRRTAAELLLPPTRSLARVKRSLAGLPGGGGTPIAAGLEAALHLSVALKGKGRAPQIVLLTDGRANVARDGTTGRAAGEADALAMARLIRVGGVPSLLIDTGPRPQPNAKALAAAMGAVYLPLPLADPGRLAGAVRAAMAG